MAKQFDPYHKWLAIAPDDQPPDLYRLLAVRTFEDDPDVIEAAANQRMGHLRTYQSGKHQAESQNLLNEVAAAKIVLLNPEKKAKYDEELRLENTPALRVAVPLEDEPEPPQQEPEAVPDFSTPVPTSRLSTRHRRKKKQPIVSLLVGIAAVALVAVAAFILTQDTDKGKETANRPRPSQPVKVPPPQQEPLIPPPRQDPLMPPPGPEPEPPPTNIWIAALHGNAEAVRQNLAAGAEVNGKEPQGNTPLFLAALRGHTEAARLLLDNGADTDIKNNDGNTALHMAAFFAHPEFAALLIEKGANVNVRNHDGKTPADNVSGPWSDDLEGLYIQIGRDTKMELDLERIRVARLKVAELLRKTGGH